MLDPPLPILDAEIRAAAQAVRRARDELRLEGVAEDPLGERRQVSSRYMFLELADEKDPVAPSARAWVAWLTLERVLWRDTARVGAAWHARSLRVDKLAAGELSPREARARVLGDPDPERRRAWGMALARGVGGLADAVRIRAERRAEATRLLDAAEVERVEQPFEPADAVRAAAEAWLATTDALVERRQSFTDALYAALGREAADGWPAKLGTRWLADLFRATGLTDGLSLDVGPLPVVLGATSFARALGAFGAALADADRPRVAPFVMTRGPVDLRRVRRAALFAGLAAEPPFAHHALGLGGAAAREQAQRVGRALLLGTRLDAARVLLRGVLLEPARERESRAEAITERALGAAIPGSLAGVLPLLRPGDGGRFAGLLLAAGDRQRLYQAFDEDWFRNPRAATALREEHAAPPELHATGAEIEAGLSELGRALRELLG